MNEISGRAAETRNPEKFFDIAFDVGVDKLATYLAEQEFFADMFGRWKIVQDSDFDVPDLFNFIEEFEFEALPFDEAIRFFEDKVPLTPDEMQAAFKGYSQRGFSTAMTSSLDMTMVMKNSIVDALAEGLTFRDYKQVIDAAMLKNGYATLEPYQIANIFRTNVQTAYNVGRHTQQTDDLMLDARPFWQYDAVNDSRTRATHAAMDNRIFRADHPIWKRWYPPNGFQCRCVVNSLSAADIKREDLVVEKQWPLLKKVFKPQVIKKLPKSQQGTQGRLSPDKGFGSNPGTKTFKPDFGRFPERVSIRAKGIIGKN